MKNEKPKITIAIAAYNAQKNIKDMLVSLIFQNGINDLIEEILVNSDSSSDDTVKIASQIKDDKIKIIDSKKRIGFAGVVKKILTTSKSDVVIILNDDIKIEDGHLIKKLLQPFIKESKIGLVSGNPQPMTPKNIIEKAHISSFRAYEKMRYSIRNGNNKFTCDGKVLALSRKFINSLSFPKNNKKMGNVDIYLYLSCLKNGFGYYHVRNAKVYYKSPSNFRDYANWISRNVANRFVLEKSLKSLSAKEKKPKVLLYYMFIEFFKNPLGCLILASVNIYTRFRAQSARKWFSPTWEVISTTKDLK